MIEVTISQEHVESLKEEYRAASADHIWLGVGYKFFFAWIEKEYGITNLEFTQYRDCLTGYIGKIDNPLATFFLLKK